MCGIAGVVDLAGRRAAPPSILRRMADAIVHRGPDDDGYLDLPHLGLANRRLSIVGLADGKIELGEGKSFEVPKLGTFTFNKNNVVITGEPLVFSKDNVDQYNF